MSFNGWRVFLLLAVVGLTACGPSRQDSQFAALSGYAKALRWGGVEEAVQFLAPDYRRRHPLLPVELSRWRQVRVTGYRELGDARLEADGGTLTQTVEIAVVNRHTGVERRILDRQQWRYDEASRRWWLWSGLPDLSHR